MANEMDLFWKMMGHEGVHGGGPAPQPVSFQDLPGDLQTVADQLRLTPEEVAIISAPALPGGPTIQDRLRALRPEAQVGGGTLSTDGRKIEWRREF